MNILKFGSSSLADASRMKRVVRLVLDTSQRERITLVLPAMEGVTDAFVQAAVEAESGEDHYRTVLEDVRARHIDAIRELFNPREQTRVITAIQIMVNELEELLHGIELIRECSKRTLDLVMSFGERLVCTVISHLLRFEGLDAVMIDGRDIIRTDSQFGNATVIFSESYRLAKQRLSTIAGIPVVTGFIAATEDGVTTTLGRAGSDYTAAILGAAIEAGHIEIWTDMSGVMSADPAHVEEAFVIPELSYKEAMELCYFGADFIHPYAMIPAVEKDIPIMIKDFFQPQSPGTRITSKVHRRLYPITGIASIDGIALLNVEGGGMIGIPGIAARIFGALARETVNIIIISQASSEHSICLGFKENERDKALEALKDELAREIATKRIENLDLMLDLVIIAVIGENMRGTPGISGRLFSALGQREINVLAIAQGSSERNISFVIQREDEGEALRTIHRAFLTDVKGGRS